MTSPMKMQTAVFIFFFACITALWVAVVGGSILDIVEYQFVQSGVFDVSPEWNVYGTVYTGLVNFFYFCPYVIALLGLFVLLYTIYQRYFRDDDEDDYMYYNGGRL